MMQFFRIKYIQMFTRWILKVMVKKKKKKKKKNLQDSGIPLPYFTFKKLSHDAWKTFQL